MASGKTDFNTQVREKIKKLPHSPGVYIYQDSEHTVLYVGKAVDLSKRVRQYFTKTDAVGAKTQRLVSQISDLETIPTANEFDALLLEAKLIREYMPRYNVIAKDDKSPLYVELTLKEELPHIRFVRKAAAQKILTEKGNVCFGPFQSAKVTRQLIRAIRKIVPYCTQKQRTGKSCFYTHLGLCDPCPSYIFGMPAGDRRQALVKGYRKHMFRIRDILSGKSAEVLTELRRDMELLAAEEDYENAAKIRNQIEILTTLVTRRYDPVLYTQNDLTLASVVDEERAQLIGSLAKFYPGLATLTRIECYDISNLIGLQATGSMVVLTEGLIDTSQYRRFKIRRKNSPNDTAMMREVLTRRLMHDEWPRPDLIIVDGGKGQVTAAKTVLSEKNVTIPLIGLAKREEEIIVPVPGGFKVLRLPFTSPALHLLQRIRDEAHRFAITYHRKLRGKAFLEYDH